MNRKLWIGIAAVIGSAAVLQSSGSGSVNWQTGAALAAPAAQDRLIAAAGLVEPVSELRQLESTMIGRLVALKVEEGDHVTAGQVVAEIENADIKAQLGEAEAALLARQNELTRLVTGARPQEIDQARAALSEAEAAAAEARSNFDRQTALGSRKLVSDAAVEQALASRDTTVARRALAAAQFALLTAPPRREDVGIARANVASARARVDEINAQIEKTVIRSPVNGKVLKLYRRQGETVTNLPPTLIATVGDVTRLRVRADIDQSDIAKLVVGQAVSITADAYSGKRFRGVVARIGDQLGHKNFRTNEPEERVDTKVLEVLIDLEPGANLPIGLPVDVIFDGSAKSLSRTPPKSKDQPDKPAREVRQSSGESGGWASTDAAPKLTEVAASPTAEAADLFTPGASTAMLQIGSYAAVEEAQKASSEFSAHHGDFVEDLSADIRKADLGDKGVRYRVRFGPLANANAGSLCDRLKAQGIDCLVVAS